MKRSEMVEIMANEIASFKGKPPSRNDSFEASSLLTLMIRLGMLPPAHTSDIYLRSECDYAMINEWEPENE